MNDIISEFINLVTNKAGKVASTRLNERYFANIGKLNVWREFNRLTANLTGSIGDKVILVKAGYVDRMPTCVVCGNPVHIVDRKISKYCSANCAHHDVGRAQKISATKRAADHSEANNKRRRTMLDKYGCEYNSQRDDIHEIWCEPKLPPETHKKLNNRQWLYQQYIVKNKSASQIAIELNCYYGTVLWYCRKFNFKITRHYNTSTLETQIANLIAKHNVGYDRNHVGLYNDGREVDLFVNDFNVAFEINGLRWHCSRYKGANYHFNKFNDISKQIRLIQLTDRQIIKQPTICDSIVAHSLHKSNRIHGRKCSLSIATAQSKDVVDLFNTSSFTGFQTGTYYVKLTYNNQLVLAAICKRINSNTVRIVDIVSQPNTFVVGGLSKILKAATMKATNVEIVCNNNLYNGSSLVKLGCTVIGTEQRCFWTDGTKISNIQQPLYYQYYDAGITIYKYNIK